MEGIERSRVESTRTEESRGSAQQLGRTSPRAAASSLSRSMHLASSWRDLASSSRDLASSSRRSPASDNLPPSSSRDLASISRRSCAASSRPLRSAHSASLRAWLGL